MTVVAIVFVVVVVVFVVVMVQSVVVMVTVGWRQLCGGGVVATAGGDLLRFFDRLGK